MKITPRYLIQIPTDQLDRMRTQAKLIGIANLIRSADLLAEWVDSDARCNTA